MSALLVTQLVSAALLPPLSLVIALATGLFFFRRRPRLAMSLILVSTCALYTLSTPWMGELLQSSLEIAPPVRPEALAAAEAIVVLGGGRRLNSPEYGGDTLNSTSLERLRYAARLHRASGLPILVTGGKPDGGSRAEGRIMRQVLEEEYGIPPQWVEDRARTTWDNAHFSAPLLEQAGIQRIALVTHAWHLRRAAPLFEAQGLTVIPAGTQFSSARMSSVFDLLPTPAGLRSSAFALHEWLGILWYKLRSNLA